MPVQLDKVLIVMIKNLLRRRLKKTFKECFDRNDEKDSDDVERRQTYAEGWKLYPVSMIIHHIQGLGVAVAILLGSLNIQILSFLWGLMYIAYQGLSVLRKKDSPGLDIYDFIMGMGFGAIIVVVLKVTGIM